MQSSRNGTQGPHGGRTQQNSPPKLPQSGICLTAAPAPQYKPWQRVQLARHSGKPQSIWCDHLLEQQHRGQQPHNACHWTGRRQGLCTAVPRAWKHAEERHYPVMAHLPWCWRVQGAMQRPGRGPPWIWSCQRMAATPQACRASAQLPPRRRMQLCGRTRLGGWLGCLRWDRAPSQRPPGWVG